MTYIYLKSPLLGQIEIRTKRKNYKHRFNHCQHPLVHHSRNQDSPDSLHSLYLNGISSLFSRFSLNPIKKEKIFTKTLYTYLRRTMYMPSFMFNVRNNNILTKFSTHPFPIEQCVCALFLFLCVIVWPGSTPKHFPVSVCHVTHVSTMLYSSVPSVYCTA